jgi:hypothetical protein
MHRIDTDGHVGNLFNEGDPLVPRQPTQIDKFWLNAIQEELVSIVLDAASGLALVKNTNNQVLAALRAILTNRTTDQTIDGIKTFVKSLVAQAGVAITQSVANSDALNATGNGNGRAAVFTGGATGGGINCIGNSDQPAVNAVQTASGYPVVCNGDTTAPVRAALRLVPQNADPTTPDTGALYVTSAGVLKIYNGTAWVVVGTQT